MKNFITSLFVAAAMLMAGCDDDKGVKTPNELSVNIAAGEATATSLLFSVMASEVGECAYLCTAEQISADATQIFAEGVAIMLDANGFARCEVEGLQPATTYHIHVALQTEQGVTTASESIATHAAEVGAPSVTLTPKSVSSNSISFVVTPTNAEECRYMLFEKGDMPDIDTVLTQGVEVAAAEATDVTVEELYSSSEYWVVAAVKTDDMTFACEPIAMTTLAGDKEYVTLAIDNMSGGEWYANDNYFLCLRDSQNQRTLELDLYMAAGDGQHLLEGRYCLKYEDTNDAPQLYIGEQYSRLAEVVNGVDRGSKLMNAYLDIERGAETYKFSFYTEIYDEERVITAVCEGVPFGCTF